MRTKKTIMAIFASLVIIILSITPAFAANTENADSHTISVVNTVGLNNIHIELNQYDVVDGNKVEIAENPTIVPSKSYERICEVRNLAKEAWLRVKVVYSENSPAVGDDFLTIASNKWKKLGGYYYYTEKVPNGKTVEFFKSINIPAEWGNSYAGVSISFTVYADAVQTQNFDPDFNSEDPWFGTIVEHRVRDDYAVPSNSEKTQFSIVYENGAEGLIRVGDDFFSNWETLMPGDVVKDKMVIRNNYAYPTSIFFRANTISDDALIKKLQLRIYTKYGDIFYGYMSEQIREVELVKLNKGETIEVFYELTVPRNLGNSFSLSKTKTEWIFRAHSDNMVNPPSPDATGRIEPGSSGNGSPDYPDAYNVGWNDWNNGGEKYGSSPIQTGDVSIIITIGAAVIIIFVTLFIIVKGRKRDEES